MEKIKKLRSAIEKLGIDGILITNSYNRRYMTNFTGSAGVVLISTENAQFITDFRYIEQATKQCEGYEIVQHKGSLPDEVAKQVKKLGIKNLDSNRIIYHIHHLKHMKKPLERNLCQFQALLKSCA